MIRRLALFIDDLRLAGRGLSRNPGFSAVTILTLALGMGGTAAIYTLLDRVVLDPLSYPDSDRLVRLSNQVPGVGPDAVWGMSTAQQVYFAEESASLDAVGLYRYLGANILTDEGPRRARGWRATSGLFPLIGARARLGRVITAEDDVPGSPLVVVISNGFWQRQFGADPEIIGRTIQISDNPYEVIGVLESGVRVPGVRPGRAAELWMPMRIDPDGYFGNNHVFNMMGRLAPGTDPSMAETELERLTARLPERFPTAYSENFLEGTGFRTQVTPLKEAVVGEMSRNLWILFGAVGIVLLIACANVANLFLVRMDGRRRELAVRLAMGASRGALFSHMVAEGLVLASAGGALALLVCLLALPAVLSIAPDAVPRIDTIGVTGETVLFVVTVSVFVGLALGAYSLVRGSIDPEELSGGGRTASDGRSRRRLRSALVVSQVSLALTLVVGAGLLVQSLRKLQAIDPGMDPDGVMTASLYLTPNRYENDAQIWRAYDEILDRITAIPQVVAAGMSEEIPVEGRFGCTVQGFEEAAVYDHLREVGLGTCAGQERATPGYFEAAGIPIIQGRSFTEADNDFPTRGAVIVSRAFAERFWPDQNPIGKGVAPSGRRVEPYYHVVGVTGDIPARSLDGDPAIAVYYPVVHNPDTPGNWGWWRATGMILVVRTTLDDPVSIFPQVRSAVAEVDPTIPFAAVRSMDDIIAESTARFTFTSILLGIAAAVALVLAAVGLYGVVSYVVSRSTREIAMRIAVGARPNQVERAFVRRSLVLVVGGLLGGLLLALGTTRVMRNLLYGVEPTDPGVFVAAAVMLSLVALMASWIPARRASRVDPVEALRAE